MLAKLLNNQTANWEQKLSDMIYGFRIVTSTVTGHSSYFLMYGQMPCIPLSKCLRAENNTFSNHLDDLSVALKHASHATAETRKHKKGRFGSKGLMQPSRQLVIR